MRISPRLSLCALSLLVSACGGSGGGDDEGIVFQGTLTERAGTDHSKASLRHGAGERIGEVKICALGECSVTDGAGQWGFRTPESYRGGPVELSVDGHGILTTVAVDVPAGAGDVTLDLGHADGRVTVGEMSVDTAGESMVVADAEP